MRKCNNCLLPETYETIEIDSNDNSCNMCKTSKFKEENVDWGKRKNMLDKVIEKYRGKYDYDCIVPFSGGKDSTFTLLYLIEEYNIKPLVVRFNHGFMRSNHERNVEKVLELEGAGEIYINNISNDGLMRGYNLGLTKYVLDHSKLPIISCGGAGNFKHVSDAFIKTEI